MNGALRVLRAEFVRAHSILSARASADLGSTNLKAPQRTPFWGAGHSAMHVWRGGHEPRPWADTLAELLTAPPERGGGAPMPF